MDELGTEEDAEGGGSEPTPPPPIPPPLLLLLLVRFAVVCEPGWVPKLEMCGCELDVEDEGGAPLTAGFEVSDDGPAVAAPAPTPTVGPPVAAVTLVLPGCVELWVAFGPVGTVAGEGGTSGLSRRDCGLI